MMYEMINYLLTLSWLRYVPKRIKNPDIPGIIAACFDRFVEEVVVAAPSKYDGNFHKFLKFTPFESLHKLYCTFECPMLIEDLCTRLLNTTDRGFEDKLPFLPPYYQYLLQGKNVVGPDGFMSYLANEVANFDLNMQKLRPEPVVPAELRVLGLIGVPNIVRAIKEAVPEAINPINDELDAEYKLSFNDFCDILVNLVTIYLDMSEDYYRKLLDAREKELTGVAPQWLSNADRDRSAPTSENSTASAKKKMQKRKSKSRT